LALDQVFSEEYQFLSLYAVREGEVIIKAHQEFEMIRFGRIQGNYNVTAVPTIYSQEVL
jgi:hypothetical protein